MSLAPFKPRKTLGRALRRKKDDGGWGEELGLAAIEAAVLCAPVAVAGAFELYIAREKARLKLEVERVKAAHRAIEAEGE